MEKVHFLGIPKNKIVCVLKGIYVLITNFHKNPNKILKSLNIFKYKKNALSLKLLYTIVQFIDKKFDIIHCHFGPVGIIGAQIKDLEIKGKYITTFHGYDANGFSLRYGKDVYNDLFKNCDIFTTNTEFTKKKVLELGCCEKKIKVLPMGINLEKFKFCERKINHGESIKILSVSGLFLNLSTDSISTPMPIIYDIIHLNTSNKLYL